MADNLTVFISGKVTNEKCPENHSDNCDCGGELECGYGCTPFGLGMYMICKECSNIYNFSEDAG